MGVYVDPLFTFPKRNIEGNLWCHMMADAIDELHAFARRIGRNRCWFDVDHYDLTPSFRARAVSLGAVEVTGRALVEIRRKARAARTADNEGDK